LSKNENHRCCDQAELHFITSWKLWATGRGWAAVERLSVSASLTSKLDATVSCASIRGRRESAFGSERTAEVALPTEAHDFGYFTDAQPGRP
jgi:hypothetical protein